MVDLLYLEIVTISISMHSVLRFGAIGNTLRCWGPPVAPPSSTHSGKEAERWCSSSLRSSSHHLSASLELRLVSRWAVLGGAYRIWRELSRPVHWNRDRDKFRREPCVFKVDGLGSNCTCHKLETSGLRYSHICATSYHLWSTIGELSTNRSDRVRMLNISRAINPSRSIACRKSFGQPGWQHSNGIAHCCPRPQPYVFMRAAEKPMTAFIGA
jgi:hypothetical protein